MLENSLVAAQLVASREVLSSIIIIIIIIIMVLQPICSIVVAWHPK
jgi:hypothetical protein